LAKVASAAIFNSEYTTVEHFLTIMYQLDARESGWVPKMRKLWWLYEWSHKKESWEEASLATLGQR